MRSSEQGGAEPNATWQERGRTHVTKEAYIEPMWERFGKTAFFATIPIQNRVTMRVAMECTDPNVQLILDLARKSCGLNRRRIPLARRSKLRVAQERYVGRRESNRLNHVTSSSGNSVRVMFGNPRAVQGDKKCESKWTENREQSEWEMINDLEVTDKLHETDELHNKSAKELSDHAARFQPSYWTFVGPNAENNWTDDKCQTRKPNRNWDRKASETLQT